MRPRDPIRILLVDDDEDEYILTRDRLADTMGAGISLTWASTYEEGLAAIIQEDCDVCLVDYSLGKQNGLDLLRAAHARNCTVPVIVLTGQGDRAIDVEAMKAGAMDYLDKAKLTAPLLERSIRYAIERWHAAEELRRSKEKYRLLTETAQDVVLTHDMEGRIRYINPAGLATYGYSAEEVLGAPIKAFLTPESQRDVGRRHAQRLAGDQGHHRYESEFIDATGKPIVMEVSSAPIETDGEIQQILVVARDITERKQTQAELERYSEQLEAMVEERTAEVRAERARLETILQNANNGIVVTNDAGEIEIANRVAQNWFNQMLSTQQAEALLGAVRAVAQQAAERPTVTLEIQGIEYEINAARVEEEGASPTNIVSIYDITHLKSLNRMRNRIITNLSHEMRTPITVLKLYLEMLERHPEKASEYIAVLNEQNERLADLVQGVLDIAYIDAGHLDLNLQPLMLDPLIENTIERYRSIAKEKAQTIRYRPAMPSPIAMADAGQLVQAIQHLLDNAIRYTPVEGEITVTTGRESDGDRAYATISVTDTGMGIPKSEQSQLFERFFRGEEARAQQIPGTGLGLPIVQEIVNLHHGKISVKSQVGTGSTFIVWLPEADHHD